jgi:nucleoside-diphosphate-sugar epimerase
MEDGSKERRQLMPGDLHVIFGAGQVGPHLARQLLASGRRVRIAKRSRSGPPPGAELVTGDATDIGFCEEAARGAVAVYHCMNPPYFANVWSEVVPRFMDNLVTAAGRAGARLVVLDNLYMLGRPPDGRLREDTPVNPRSRKGAIRARAAERLFEAHRRGDVRAVAGRASDFYGPGGAQSHLGDEFWPRVMVGKPGRTVVDPDAVHTYHYIPDVATGLAALGTAADDVCGRPWMLPCEPAGTLRDLVGRLSRPFGREIGIARLPRWLVKAAGLFVPILRELDEMAYQWEGPFVVDDSQFRERFDLPPTAADDAARATVDWAREAYARGPVNR